MIDFDAAQELLRAATGPIGAETVPLAHAAGRILAEPVVSAIDSPRAHVSTMDGYALRSCDLAAAPTRLRIVTENYPGTAEAGAIAAGECARVFTGAPVPDNADTVVVQEDVERQGEHALFTEPAAANRYIRQRASDFSVGTPLLAAGTQLGPRQLVAAAGADRAEVTCWRYPRVSVLVTGDELAEPGTAHQRPGAVPDSASYGVAALAERYGATVMDRTGLPDDIAELERIAASAVEASDLVVVTGGASVGARDFAKAMFAPLGPEPIFAKVAMKPGKPVWLSRIGGKLVLGLPGNPTSAMVTARLFLAPLIAGLGGRDPASVLDWSEGVLGSSLSACGERETFVRARRDTEGRLHPLGNQDSGAQHALALADALIRQSAGSPAGAAGAHVRALTF